MRYNHQEIRNLTDEALSPDEFKNLFFNYFAKNTANEDRSDNTRTLIDDALRKKRINEIIKFIKDTNARGFNDYKDKIFKRVDLLSKKITEKKTSRIELNKYKEPLEKEFSEFCLECPIIFLAMINDANFPVETILTKQPSKERLEDIIPRFLEECFSLELDKQLDIFKVLNENNQYSDYLPEVIDILNQKKDEKDEKDEKDDTDQPNDTELIVNETIDLQQKELAKKKSIDPPVTESHNTSNSPPNENPINPEEIPQLLLELSELLEKKEWEEADTKTTKIMQKAAGKNPGENWGENDIMKFSHQILKDIDGMWRKYSDEQFGFSIQVSIWNNCQENGEDSRRLEFGKKVGWYDKKWLSRSKWEDDEYFRKKINKKPPDGILPTLPFSPSSRINVKFMNKFAIRLNNAPLI